MAAVSPGDQDVDPGHYQCRQGQGGAFVLDQHQGRQQQAGCQTRGGREPRRQEQQHGAAVEAGQRQIVVGAHRAATGKEGREGQQGSGQDRPAGGGPPGPGPRSAVDQPQPGSEESGVDRPVEGLVLARPRHLLDGGLGHRQEHRIPGMGDVPAALREHAGVHRPLGPDVARLGSPRHAAVPVPLGIGEGVAEDAEQDEGAEGEDEAFHPPPGNGSDGSVRSVGSDGSCLSPRDPPPKPRNHPRHHRQPGHRHDGGGPQGHTEEMREGVEQPGRPGDAEEPGVGPAVDRRQGADGGKHLGEPRPGGREESQAADPRQGLSRNQSHPSSAAGTPGGRAGLAARLRGRR